MKRNQRILSQFMFARKPGRYQKVPRLKKLGFNADSAPTVDHHGSR
jgi:hypothetical protein